MSEQGKSESLPPAHPDFTSHFASRFYDADDYENDDLPPFGSDEGWDEVHDWADRLDELQAHPTLRYMLGEDADRQIEELRNTSQIDVDDILIGQGFTLLRFIGQIDPEGRIWLDEALRRQDRRSPGQEYETMIEDLASFGAGSTNPRPPAASRKVKSKPKLGKKRHPKEWLTITGFNLPGMDVWLRRRASAIASDRDWRRWWSHADIDRLQLYPVPAGPPHRDETRVHRKKACLQVLGNSRKFTKTFEKFIKISHGPLPAFESLLEMPDFRVDFDGLILRLLQDTAIHLSLPRPPGQLPDNE